MENVISQLNKLQISSKDQVKSGKDAVKPIFYYYECPKCLTPQIIKIGLPDFCLVCDDKWEEEMEAEVEKQPIQVIYEGELEEENQREN